MGSIRRGRLCTLQFHPAKTRSPGIHCSTETRSAIWVADGPAVRPYPRRPVWPKLGRAWPLHAGRAERGFRMFHPAKTSSCIDTLLRRDMRAPATPIHLKAA